MEYCLRQYVDMDNYTEAKLQEREFALKNFLDGLTELTKKYDIAVGGCGCCYSPYLYDEKLQIKILQYLEWDSDRKEYA